MKVTTFKAFENPTIENIEKVLKDNLKDKYEYKIKKKASSLAGKLVNGSSGDSVTVIKNAYHRTVITVITIDDVLAESGKTTAIYFSEDEIAGWLGFLRKEGGLIGGLIIRLIYGGGDGFYEEVEKTVKTNIKGQDETLEVGLGSLLTRNK